ncbi:MAG: hypothetical protein AAF939_12110 [Planctomycetota bacterium]
MKECPDNPQNWQGAEEIPPANYSTFARANKDGRPADGCFGTTLDQPVLFSGTAMWSF